MPDTVTGAVLAGGAGSRLGGDKAIRPAGGRPLISYPIAALAAVCERVVIVAKPDTRLVPLAAERWTEPAEPRHPRVGIVYALERAASPVLVCAADMPFVTPAACGELIAAAERAAGADAVIATAGGRLQPLLGLYRASALPGLREAPPDAPLVATLATLTVASVAFPAELVRNVNTPVELAGVDLELRTR